MAADMDEVGDVTSLSFEYLIATPVRTALGGWTVAEEVVGLHGHQPTIGLERYAVVCILGGTAVYEHADGRSEQLQPGDLLVLRPRAADLYGNQEPGATWDELYVVFHGPIFDVWAGVGLGDPQARSSAHAGRRRGRGVCGTCSRTSPNKITTVDAATHSSRPFWGCCSSSSPRSRASRRCPPTPLGSRVQPHG